MLPLVCHLTATSSPPPPHNCSQLPTAAATRTSSVRRQPTALLLDPLRHPSPRPAFCTLLPVALPCRQPTPPPRTPASTQPSLLHPCSLAAASSPPPPAATRGPSEPRPLQHEGPPNLARWQLLSLIPQLRPCPPTSPLPLLTAASSPLPPAVARKPTRPPPPHRLAGGRTCRHPTRGQRVRGHVSGDVKAQRQRSDR